MVRGSMVRRSQERLVLLVLHLVLKWISTAGRRSCCPWWGRGQGGCTCGCWQGLLGRHMVGLHPNCHVSGRRYLHNLERSLVMGLLMGLSASRLMFTFTGLVFIRLIPMLLRGTRGLFLPADISRTSRRPQGLHVDARRIRIVTMLLLTFPHELGII